jgi:exopolysaccharide biosynthesis protein
MGEDIQERGTLVVQIGDEPPQHILKEPGGEQVFGFGAYLVPDTQNYFSIKELVRDVFHE